MRNEPYTRVTMTLHPEHPPVRVSSPNEAEACLVTFGGPGGPLMLMHMFEDWTHEQVIDFWRQLAVQVERTLAEQNVTVQ